VVLPAKLISRKIQDGGGRLVKITLLPISRPLLHIFAPNLTQRLQMGSCSQIYHQNSLRSKIQDGRRRHFEIC